jgi:hypothetical protein
MLEYIIKKSLPYFQIVGAIISIAYTLYKYRKDRQHEKKQREQQLEEQHKNGVPLPPRRKRRTR